MLKEERKRFILNEVRIHNRVLLGDIAEVIGVSIDTIRRDVKELHDEKKLKKVYGGAISLGFFSSGMNGEQVYAYEEKLRIAQKAMQLLENGQVVLISGGTTNIQIARIWPDRLKLTCFTPSISVANQLANKRNTEVILIGGKLDKDSKITVGGATINMLGQIKADLCFLGTNSIDAKVGITEFDWEIVQMKKAMIRSSKKLVSPAIAEKFSSVKRYKICEAKDIDILITELDPSNPKLNPFKEMNIDIL